MRYKKELFISKEDVNRINHYLHNEPTDETECLGEDVTIVYTAVFDNGIEMDIKCCGVQYQEGESNTAWTEAVLFKDGNEVAHTEPDEDICAEPTCEFHPHHHVPLAKADAAPEERVPVLVCYKETRIYQREYMATPEELQAIKEDGENPFYDRIVKFAEGGAEPVEKEEDYAIFDRDGNVLVEWDD